MPRRNLSRYRVTIQLSLHAGRRGALAASAFAEHALEDRIDVLEVIAEVELAGYFGVAEILLHSGVLLQQRLEVASAAPHRHGVAWHEPVGVLAAGALLRQRHQMPLRVDEAA